MAQNDQHAPIVIIPWRRPDSMDKQEENVRALERIIQLISGGGFWILAGTVLEVDPSSTAALNEIIISPTLSPAQRSEVHIFDDGGSTVSVFVSLTSAGHIVESAGTFITVTCGSNYTVNATGRAVLNANDHISLAPVSVASIPVFISTPAAAPGNPDPGAISFYLDEAGNNLKVKVTYSDGVTHKTGTVALV